LRSWQRGTWSVPVCISSASESGLQSSMLPSSFSFSACWDRRESFCIPFITIVPCLPWTARLFNSFFLYQCPVLGTVSVIFTFDVSKPCLSLPFLRTTPTASNPLVLWALWRLETVTLKLSMKTKTWHHWFIREIVNILLQLHTSLCSKIWVSYMYFNVTVTKCLVCVKRCCCCVLCVHEYSEDRAGRTSSVRREVRSAVGAQQAGGQSSMCFCLRTDCVSFVSVLVCTDWHRYLNYNCVVAVV